MRLRNRDIAEQRASSKAVVKDGLGYTDCLPGELMQMLAGLLSQEDVARASMVCKSWARVFRAGITSATMVVGSNGDHLAPWPEETLDALAEHTSVSELQLLLNSRSDYNYTYDTFSGLYVLPKLKHLHLRFLMSQTPKKGTWPVLFADDMTAEQLESLTVESATMPPLALSNLLGNLNPQESNPSKLTLLDIKLGQQVPGSQLPAFITPAWLKDTTGSQKAELDDVALPLIAALSSLVILRCTIGPVTASSYTKLCALTNLTELVLYSKPLPLLHMQQLTNFKSLRRLVCAVRHFSIPDFVDLDLNFLQELDLKLAAGTAQQADTVLKQLLDRPPAALRGLTVEKLCIAQKHVADLEMLTQLTSLHVVDCSANYPLLDLTPLGQMTGLQQLTLQVSQPMELMQLKFVPPAPPAKPERVRTGACESVGKRRKSAAQQPRLSDSRRKQQKEPDTPWGDITALPAAWPHLQVLKLSGLPPLSVSLTSWEGLSRLTGLTSLTLQFQPPSQANTILAERCNGLKQPPESPGGSMPVVLLEHLPTGVRELQLASCYVGVPVDGYMRSGPALKTLSLSKCYLGSVLKGKTDRHGRPICTASSSAYAGTPGNSELNTQPLLRLLQHTEQLQMLELIDLPWLSDAVLTAAAEQTQLRQLESLSIVGIGNQHLTHGSLLGLTGLRKLRELRWHVGSVLDLMPDVQALAQLRGLMTVHLPHWLHNQMERWGAYAALDSMPMCDVNVELA